mmetsp:Transcript_41707/g.67659  ORF Transcript_41707/g.67659 Transcript_41707/m.67659 type:complete len:592 (+) Transcript_41707:55-1830(+)
MRLNSTGIVSTLSVLVFLVGALLLVVLPCRIPRVQPDENALLTGSSLATANVSLVSASTLFAASFSAQSVPVADFLLESLRLSGAAASKLEVASGYGPVVWGVFHPDKRKASESIVLCLRYRRKNNAKLAERNIGVGVAYALTKFVKSCRWLAVNLILLATDASDTTSVGLKKWLEIYFSAKPWDQGFLYNNQFESAFPRGGLIRAALILDIDWDFSSLEIIVEGTHGQLPNLDLVSIFYELRMYTSLPIDIQSGSSGTPPPTKWLAGVIKWFLPDGYPFQDWWSSLEKMAIFSMHQSSYIPRHDHSCFLCYNVDAITLKSVKSKSSGAQGDRVHSLIILLELAIRSLSNLEERLHHATSSYILGAVPYVASLSAIIIPVLVMMAAPVIQALWLVVQSVQLPSYRLVTLLCSTLALSVAIWCLYVTPIVTNVADLFPKEFKRFVYSFPLAAVLFPPFSAFVANQIRLVVFPSFIQQLDKPGTVTVAHKMTKVLEGHHMRIVSLSLLAIALSALFLSNISAGVLAILILVPLYITPLPAFIFATIPPSLILYKPISDVLYRTRDLPCPYICLLLSLVSSTTFTYMARRGLHA